MLRVGGALLLCTACATSRLERVAQASLAATRVPGLSVAVLRHGEPEYVQGFGLADVAQHVPVTPATRFYWVGAGQEVLGALTMRAVEQGKLRLDDRIGPGSGITFRELADCTSGLPDFHYLGDRFDAFAGARRSGDEVTALFAGLPLRHAPGERWEWTVSGFHLLGVALEKAFGAPLREVARKEVFERAGVDADLCDGSFLPDQLAARHSAGANGVVASSPRHPSVWAYASAAYCGTPLAAARLAYALRTGRVVEPSSFQQMIAPHAAMKPPAALPAFGVVVMVGALDGHRYWGATGHTMGHATVLLDLPDDDVIVMVAASADADLWAAGSAIARAAVGAHFELPVAEPLPRLPPEARPATDAALAGVYALRFVRGGPQHAPYAYSVRVAPRFGALSWQTCGELPEPLFALPDGSFRVASRPDEPIRFSGPRVESDEGGEVFAGERVADDQLCAAR